MLTAAARGETARVKELLDRGVDVNMRGDDRNTPIMEAAYGEHVDTVRLLLDRGADLSAKKNDGSTPMSLTGNKEILELFKNVSALVDASAQGNNQIVKDLIGQRTPVNGLNQFGQTALTEACGNGKTETVKLLLENGADPSIKKSDGATPLNLASSQKHSEIVALLNVAIAKQTKSTPSPPVR
jgi:uncharacterized protein